jgi:NTP pyrophosphatase (non-canonical NTP hydrolase)
VDRERTRQEELKASGRFAYTCADAECTDGQALAILVEKVGEVARAMCEGKGLRDELIQVAAVAVAWVERLDTPTRTIDVFCPTCGYMGEVPR